MLTPDEAGTYVTNLQEHIISLKLPILLEVIAMVGNFDQTSKEDLPISASATY